MTFPPPSAPVRLREGEAGVTGDPQLLAAAAALRAEVFTAEQGVDPAVERDGADETAVHVVVLGPHREVLGTGRLVATAEGDPCVPGGARLGRIAVRADARGRGLGQQVVRELERAAGRLGLLMLWLHAQEPVIGFYRRLGYQAVGEADVEAGLAHQWMRRELVPGLRPVRDTDAAAITELIGGCFAEYRGCVLDLPGIDAWMRRPATASAETGGAVWVADPVVACGGWRPVDADTIELKSLYVARAWRRRGYAAALVGAVERVARARGANQVQLWSDTRFRDAHRLYRKLGYEQLPGSRVLHDPSNTVEWCFRREVTLPRL